MSQKVKTLKLAIYHNTEFDYKTEGPPSLESENYIRLSEFVDVEFPLLPHETVVNLEVASIDREIANVQAKCEVTVNTLKARKSELLALPPPDAIEDAETII